MIIAHLADIHCRNYTRHDEYRAQFKKLYKSLKEKNVDAIVLAGDIVHSKLQISPELVDLVGWFFRSLSEIAPTYIIPGNHDGNVKNMGRLDALSPIINNLDCDNLFYHKKSTIVNINDVSLGLYSMFDDDGNEPDVNDVPEGNISVAVYHGTVQNSLTDMKFQLPGIPLSTFKGWDYVLLGDIHQQQYLNHKNTVAYCGSTIQQNHGEKPPKGYMVWDTSDGSSEFVKLKNDWGYVTIRVDDSLQLPDLDIDMKYPRIRLIVSDAYLSIYDENRLRQEIKERYNPIELRIINNDVVNPKIDTEISQGLIKSIREEDVQNKLLKEYVQVNHSDIENEVYKKIFEIDETVTKKLSKTEITRNVKWNLNRFEWHNLFNYGEKNYINFDELQGIVGIFAQNASGKSAILDSILYTMFNATSRSSGGGRGSLGNGDIVNRNCDFGAGEVIAGIGDKKYKISRNTIKSLRNKRDGTTQEIVRTDVEYSLEDGDEYVNLNGEQRNQTDKNIRKTFGTIEDFSTTSLSAQHDSLNFITKSPRERKEILAKFLDLGIFDEKYKIAKEYLSEVKANIRVTNMGDLTNHIVELDNKQKEEVAQNLVLQASVKKLEKELKEENDKISVLLESLHPVEDIYENDLQEQLRDLDSELGEAKLLKEDSKKDFKDSVNSHTDLKFRYDTEKSALIEVQNTYDKMMIEYNALSTSVSNTNKDITNATTLTENLENIPEEECLTRDCYFIRDAQRAQSELGRLRDLLGEQLLEQHKTDPDHVRTQLNVQKVVVESIEEELDGLLERRSRSNDLYNKASSDVKLLSLKRETLIEEIDLAKRDAKKISENKVTKEKINKLKWKVYDIEKSLKETRSELQQNIFQSGSSKKALEQAKEQMKEVMNMSVQKHALEIYVSAMSRDGIQKNIIKKNLPVFNREINKILSNVVDFNVFIDGNNDLDIYIDYDKDDRRPLELGSGMEKTIASIAIRVALIMSTNLPRPTIFIIDEGFGTLDSENLANIRSVFEYLKNFFKNILIITHIDSIKDVADHIISIGKDENDNAYVRV